MPIAGDDATIVDMDPQQGLHLTSWCWCWCGADARADRLLVRTPARARAPARALDSYNPGLSHREFFMLKRTIPSALLVIGFLSTAGAMQEPATPWRNDAVFQRLARALDPVLAIDTHTHLLGTGKFDPALAEQVPLLLRSTHPWFSAIIKARFGLGVDPRDWAKEDAAIRHRTRGDDQATRRARLLDGSPRLQPDRNRPRQLESALSDRRQAPSLGAAGRAPCYTRCRPSI